MESARSVSSRMGAASVAHRCGGRRRANDGLLRSCRPSRASRQTGATSARGTRTTPSATESSSTWTGSRPVATASTRAQRSSPYPPRSWRSGSGSASRSGWRRRRRRRGGSPGSAAARAAPDDGHLRAGLRDLDPGPVAVVVLARLEEAALGVGAQLEQVLAGRQPGHVDPLPGEVPGVDVGPADAQPDLDRVRVPACRSPSRGTARRSASAAARAGRAAYRRSRSRPSRRAGAPGPSPVVGEQLVAGDLLDVPVVVPVAGVLGDGRRDDRSDVRRPSRRSAVGRPSSWS